MNAFIGRRTWSCKPSFACVQHNATSSQSQMSVCSIIKLKQPKPPLRLNSSHHSMKRSRCISGVSTFHKTWWHLMSQFSQTRSHLPQQYMDCYYCLLVQPSIEQTWHLGSEICWTQEFHKCSLDPQHPQFFLSFPRVNSSKNFMTIYP